MTDTTIPEDRICADCFEDIDDPAHHCPDCGDHVDGLGVCNSGCNAD